MTVTAAVVNSPGWAPSVSRTLTIPSAAGTSLRGVSAIPPRLMWPDKSMADQLDFNLDASLWVADLGGDKLAAASVLLITPNAAIFDLHCAWSALFGNVLVCWLTGGEPFVTYCVTAKFSTVLGRLAVQPVQIKIGV